MKPRGLKSEPQLCAWILNRTRKSADCEDLYLRFVLVRRAARVEDQPSWDLRAVTGWGEWSLQCRDHFLDAVREAQERFDLLFGPTEHELPFPGDANGEQLR